MKFVRATGLSAAFSVAALALSLGAPRPAPTQLKGFASFPLVRARNIFDPDRQPMVMDAPPPSRTQAPRQNDFFALTGTLVTADKALAFFAGSRPEFGKVLSTRDTIAGATVDRITPSHVEVNRGGKRISVAVGQQLLLDGTAPTAYVPSAEVTTDSQSAPVTGGAPATNPGSMPSNDILRRMMERRQKETSR